MKLIAVNKNIRSLFEFIYKNKNEILISSLIISLLFALVSEFYYIPFFLLFAVVLYKYLSEKTFILLSIIILISFTGEALESIRDYFTIIAIAGLFLFFLKRYGLDFRNYPRPPILLTYIWFLFLFTILFITFVNSFHFRGIDALFRSSVFFLISYFLYAFLEEKENRSNYYYLILGLFLASLILSITVYYELFTTGLTVFLVEGFFARFAGAYGNYNTLAFIMSVNIVISVIALYSPKISLRIKRYLIPLYILNNASVIFLTNSRASILALIVAMLFLFYFLNKKVIIVFSGIGLILFVLYLLEPFTQSLVDAYIRIETVSQREYLWASGIEIMKDYPVFGVGTEMFPYKFYTYVPTSGSYMFDLFRILQKPHPHNYSLWLITENGILGWICALSLFGVYLFMGFKLISNLSVNKEEAYYFAIGLTAIGIMVFVRSFFEVEGIFSYGYISRDLPFWISYILLAYFYKSQMILNREDAG
jgi:O-antigen ligase